MTAQASNDKYLNHEEKSPSIEFTEYKKTICTKPQFSIFFVFYSFDLIRHDFWMLFSIFGSWRVKWCNIFSSWPSNLRVTDLLILQSSRNRKAGIVINQDLSGSLVVKADAMSWTTDFESIRDWIKQTDALRVCTFGSGCNERVSSCSQMSTLVACGLAAIQNPETCQNCSMIFFTHRDLSTLSVLLCSTSIQTICDVMRHLICV